MKTFEQNLWEAQPALLAHVRLLCGAPQESEDILGNANLALMRRQGEYDASRPFLPWARAFVFNEVRAWRLRCARSRLMLDDTTVERLGEELASEQPPDGPDQLRLELLAEARRELTPEMQYLLTRYYTYGDNLAAIGGQLNRSPHSLAISLHYIRGVLKKSVERKMRTRREYDGN